ncbi:hypothetical protein GCM10022221_34750 [Actinocorallia aurea]
MPRGSVAADRADSVDAVLGELRAWFPGVMFWRGEYSGFFWAMTWDRLFDARTPGDLAGRLREAGRPWSG